MQKALDSAKKGTMYYSSPAATLNHFSEGGAWRGIHNVDEFKNSTNQDYLLECGMVTNSCCVYYLQYYREQIPLEEIDKLRKMVEFYGIKWNDNWFNVKISKNGLYGIMGGKIETMTENNILSISKESDKNHQLDFLGDIPGIV